MKKFRKIVIISLSILLLFLLMGMDLPVRCSVQRYRRGNYIETENWTLWQRTQTRNVYLVSLNNRALIVDGVLTIPERVDTHNVYSFRSFSPGTGVNKMVVSATIKVDAGLWTMSSVNRPRYIEILCQKFDNIYLTGGGHILYSYNTGW